MNKINNAKSILDNKVSDNKIPVFAFAGGNSPGCETSLIRHLVLETLAGRVAATPSQLPITRRWPKRRRRLF